MRTSESLGILTGALPGQSIAYGTAPQIVPIEFTYDKTNDITLQIDAKGKKVLLRGNLQVITLFNAAGTDLFSGGTGDDANDLFDGQTLAAAGVFESDYVLLEDERTTLTFSYAYTSTAPTTGRAILWLEVVPFPNFFTQDA